MRSRIACATLAGLLIAGAVAGCDGRQRVVERDTKTVVHDQPVIVHDQPVIVHDDRDHHPGDRPPPPPPDRRGDRR
jgi:hypothetical protein